MYELPYPNTAAFWEPYYCNECGTTHADDGWWDYPYEQKTRWKDHFHPTTDQTLTWLRFFKPTYRQREGLTRKRLAQSMRQAFVGGVRDQITSTSTLWGLHHDHWFRTTHGR